MASFITVVELVDQQRRLAFRRGPRGFPGLTLLEPDWPFLNRLRTGGLPRATS